MSLPERTIHLVNPAEKICSYFGKSVSPSLGLAVVGSMASQVVAEEGFRQEVGIHLTDEHLRREVDVRPGDLVLITTLISTTNRAKTIAVQVKEAGAEVVFGGPEASLRQELFLNYGKVFAGEAGNSEAFRRMMAEYLSSGILNRDLYVSEGLANPANIALDGLPVNLDIYRDIDENTLLPMTFLSLGCPYSCDFCAANVLSGRTIRSRPAEEVVEEIRKRGLSGFNLVDSNPPFSDQWDTFLELVTNLSVRNGWTVELSMNVLAGRKGEKLLGQLRRAECQRILIGVESPFANNLESVNKGHNLKEWDIKKRTVEVVKKIHENGIKVTLLLIVGFPEDNKERILALADFVKETQADGANIFILTPLPGTALWDRLAEQGVFEPETIPSAKFDLRHSVWNHPMGSSELEASYRHLCQEIWSPWSMAARMKRALFISGPPRDLGQKLRSAIGFELATRDQHLRTSK